MSKNLDQNFIKSTFTLSFAVEIVGLEIWHDCNEGYLELGPCVQGLRLQYQLYFGQNFDVDIAIWPHVAKVICGQATCWVRTWQFLERRWLTFSIRHAFPVRVSDLQVFEAVVNPTLGLGAISANAKGDKNVEVYLPPLEFGQRRYFGPVNSTVTSEAERLWKFIKNMIWTPLLEYIPPSFLDGTFDEPYPVADVRHQDAILDHVQEIILKPNIQKDGSDILDEVIAQKPSKDAKGGQKDKKKPEAKNKFEIKLSGDSILAGTGRVIPFATFGDKPADLGEIVVLLSSSNLPAQDDSPIVFVNINTLFDAPLQEFRDRRITHLYTRWSLGEEIHDSQPVDIRSKKITKVEFNDHHALPLESCKMAEVISEYIDDVYKIQLRGVRTPSEVPEVGNLFGYAKGDRDYGTGSAPKVIEEELDFIIANTKLDARSLSKGINGFIRGEFPLYPPTLSVPFISRTQSCTNDINMIGIPLTPMLVVPASSILTSQMTLGISMGVVGCKPPRLTSCFSRLFCLVSDSESIMSVLMKIRNINEESGLTRDEKLSGFALDTGDIVILFVEGPRDGHILEVWYQTEEFYPKMKPTFSSSSRYSTRVYSEFMDVLPFKVLKMKVPLCLLLACPTMYARPALPLPTRIAALKFGRIIQNKYRCLPPRCELPNFAELRSFRLELCSPPRGMLEKASTTQFDTVNDANEDGTGKNQSLSRINWEMSKPH
ncbi:uncharacterized protein LOC126371595 [Pectinophora gossypiella]|uniref:uncharacterized protein LOC126371595 n=1 Tax=Pectinophora gossypiella TaxID=13191 RepID=UPI00214EDAC7|nr:uncharacterized protein LOC126371595 [Pectinophora gossypiella]